MNFKTQSRFTGLSPAVAAQTFATANRLSVEQAGAVVLDEATSRAPRASGALASSGHVEVTSAGSIGAASARVVFDADHAGFVEFGTGLIGSGTYPYPLPTEGVPFTGEWIYDYKKQNWQGMESQAFLRPGLDSARSTILEIFQRNYRLAVAKLKGRG